MEMLLGIFCIYSLINQCIYRGLLRYNKDYYDSEGYNKYRKSLLHKIEIVVGIILIILILNKLFVNPIVIIFLSIFQMMSHLYKYFTYDGKFKKVFLALSIVSTLGFIFLLGYYIFVFV